MDKSNQDLTGCSQMTLSLNCKEAGDPVCTRHTMYGETEEELLADAKKHGMCMDIPRKHGMKKSQRTQITSGN
jgi:hypothetical protein